MPHSTKKQFVLNSATGWLSQGSLTVTGIVMIPYAIARLGQQGYGFFQLGRSMLDFLLFLNLGMTPTLVRFCCQAIAAKDKEEIGKISSTAQLFLGGLGLLGTIIALSLIPFFINFYEVPTDLVYETKGMLFCMAVSLLINFLFIIPNGLVCGANRHDSANLLNVLCNCLRLGLLVAAFELLHPSLLLFGLVIFLVQLIRLVGIVFLAYRYVGPTIFFSHNRINKNSFKSMFGFGLLNFINTVAAAVVFQGPVLIIGKVLGEESVTAFAPALLVAQTLQGFLGRISAPLAPLASRDVQYNKGARLGKWAIKIGQFAAVFGFSFAVPFLVFGKNLTRIWLGENLSWTWSVIAIMAIGIAISMIQSVNYYLALGGGKIFPTVISQVILSIVVFAGTTFGTVFFNWDIFLVSLFICVCFLLRNTLYLAYAYSKQFGYHFFSYQWKVHIQPVFITLISIAIGFLIKFSLQPLNVLILCFDILIVMSIYFILNWVVVLPKEIKDMIPVNRLTGFFKS